MEKIEVCLAGISNTSEKCITLFFYMCTENLALHQPAWQSSYWLSDSRAEFAVDGRNTNLELLGRQCAESYGRTAGWRVDLGGVKNIHHVFIQHVTGKSKLGIISFKVIDCYLK